MDILPSYDIIKDLGTWLFKQSAEKIKSNYRNFDFLKKSGLKLVENDSLIVYQNALFNFLGQGYDRNWIKILTHEHAIEAYMDEYVDLTGHIERFRFVIDSLLHTTPDIGELKNLQGIDDDTYDAFISEAEAAEAELTKTLSHAERLLLGRTGKNQGRDEEEMYAKIKECLIRYVKRIKAEREGKPRYDYVNRFYIEVLGKKADLEISATEYHGELDFSEGGKENDAGEETTSQDPNTDSVIQLARNVPRLFLRGNPGTGKSTSLDKVFEENLKNALNDFDKGKVPVLVEAKNYSNADDIKKYIIKALRLEPEWFDMFMERFDSVIMIDGLNEIKPNLIHKARIEIKEILDRYVNPYYIITSRTYNYESYKIEDAHNLNIKIYDVSPLDEKEIRDYINRVTQKPRVAKEIWMQIRENQNIRSLVSNPMYLRMILVVAYEDQKRKRIPRSKGELYHRFMNKLLDWEEKQYEAWEIHQKHNKRTKKFIISHLAYHMIHKRTISEEEAIELLNEKIRNYDIARRFLEELKLNYLIKQAETGNLSFIHDTYSEYFAAVWLSRYFKKHRAIPIDIGQQQWFESIMMCSDIFTDNDLLEDYLDYLLMGGRIISHQNTGELPEGGETKVDEAAEPTYYYFNPNISVGCSVAFNIAKRTDREDKEYFYDKAEAILDKYLEYWLWYYMEKGKEVIPVGRLFAAVGALCSTKQFRKIFTDVNWISVWSKPEFFKEHFYKTATREIVFSREEIEEMDRVSRESLNALINNLNHFGTFYLFVAREIPVKKNLLGSFTSEFGFLKNKLVSETARVNMESMKYFFRKSYDYDILKKIGERDIGFYLANVSTLKGIPEEDISNFLLQHPLMGTDQRQEFEALESLDEKLDFFQRSRLSTNNNISDILNIASDYISTKNYDKAKTYFLKVLSLSPTNARSLAFMVRYCKNRRNAKLGVKILSEARMLGAQSPYVISGLAYFLYYNKQYEEAINVYRELIERFGRNPHYEAKIALCYIAKDDFVNAKLILDKIPEDNILELAIIGDAYKKIGEVERALELFKKYLEVVPENVVIQGNLGDCYMKLEQFNSALKTFKTEFELNKSNVDCMISMGNCYLSLKENEKAEHWYSKAVASNPNYVKAIYNLGNFYKRTGRADKAISYFSILEDKNSDDIKHLFSISSCYYAMEEYETAMVYLRRIEKRDPNNESALGMISHLLSVLGDEDEGHRYADKVMEINPNNHQVILTRANIYKTQAKYEEAIKYLKKYLECQPENVITYSNIGDCYKKMEDYPNAIENFLKYIPHYPDNLYSIGSLASCYKKIGDYDNAKFWYYKALDIESDNYIALSSLSGLLFEIRDYEEASIYYRKFLNRQPDNKFALGRLISCLRKLGRHEEADDLREKYL